MRFQKLFAAPLFNDFLALFAGIILTFSFAPFKLFPLAIIAPAILLATWLPASKKRAFWRGWLFGLGLFSSGVYWVFISIHTFGNASLLLSSIITGGFFAILALFPAVNGYLFNRFFPINTTTKILFAFPALWVLLEWIRSWMFTGFPWLFIGYSQIDSPLRGFAPIFSVYGVSLTVALTSALLLNALIKIKQKDYILIFSNILVIILLWCTGAVLNHIHWTKPEGQPIKISLVQGNIPQELKWNPDQALPTLNRYMDLTEKHWDSRVIIWPEAALPMILQDASSVIQGLSDNANKHNATLITGIPMEAINQPGSYYNAVIALGKNKGAYTKQRLVPFGEFVPFSKTFKKLFDIMQIPMSDFVSGPRNLPPITIDNIKISTFICYEIAFPQLVLSKESDIGMILTLSNDAWFGHSIAQAQHVEMGRMRAVEMGRPVLFVSNNGITAFINPKGEIQSAAPPYATYVLTDTIQAYTGKTPWQSTSFDSILITLIIFIIIAMREQRNLREEEKE